MKCLMTALAFTAVSFTALADGPSPQGGPEAIAIRKLMICTADVVGNLEAKLNLQKATMGDASARSTYSSYIAGLFKCTDDNLSGAIAAAGDHADLKQAIKDFYIKARSYIEVLGMNDRAAYQEQSQAMDRINMEMKIAGIK